MNLTTRYAAALQPIPDKTVTPCICQDRMQKYELRFMVAEVTYSQPRQTFPV